jgi:hypothetical protein
MEQKIEKQGSFQAAVLLPVNDEYILASPLKMSDSRSFKEHSGTRPESAKFTVVCLMTKHGCVRLRCQFTGTV